MRNGIIIFLIVWMCFPLAGIAQEEKVERFETVDTLFVEAPDSVTQAVLSAAEKNIVPEEKLSQIRANFKPNPKTAVLLGLIPGAGQIYNRKYWKLPIVYGALMGCTYAITWNNRNYQDYWQAYKDIHSDNPMAHQSWKDFVPGNVTDEKELESYVTNSGFVQQLKSGKDYYRRYRDLSIIITAGVYLISVIDAYVDAQLFDFDISPDLSMRVEPVVTPKTPVTSRTVGVNCSLTF